MHDFVTTDKHAVLLEQPLYLDFIAMVGGWDTDAAWMKWKPHEGARVHLVTLDGSKVRGAGAWLTVYGYGTGKACQSRLDHDAGIEVKWGAGCTWSPWMVPK